MYAVSQQIRRLVAKNSKVSPYVFNNLRQMNWINQWRMSLWHYMTFTSWNCFVIRPLRDAFQELFYVKGLLQLFRHNGNTKHSIQLGTRGEACMDHQDCLFIRTTLPRGFNLPVCKDELPLAVVWRYSSTCKKGPRPEIRTQFKNVMTIWEGGSSVLNFDNF